MSHSLQLFNAPISDEEIRRPHQCTTVGELIHCLWQKNIVLDIQQKAGCDCANRWLQSGEPFTAYLAVWSDGNWVCFHDYVYRVDPIAPGNFKMGTTQAVMIQSTFITLKLIPPVILLCIAKGGLWMMSFY